MSVSVDEEGPAQMSCSADGNPTPTIKWTRLGSRATLSTMHVLQFDLVRESDVGTYVCIATVPGFEPIMSYGRVDINGESGILINNNNDTYKVRFSQDYNALRETTAGK